MTYCYYCNYQEEDESKDELQFMQEFNYNNII